MVEKPRHHWHLILKSTETWLKFQQAMQEQVRATQSEREAYERKLEHDALRREHQPTEVKK